MNSTQTGTVSAIVVRKPQVLTCYYKARCFCFSVITIALITISTLILADINSKNSLLLNATALNTTAIPSITTTVSSLNTTTIPSIITTVSSLISSSIPISMSVLGSISVSFCFISLILFILYLCTILFQNINKIVQMAFFTSTTLALIFSIAFGIIGIVKNIFYPSCIAIVTLSLITAITTCLSVYIFYKIQTFKHEKTSYFNRRQLETRL